MWKRIIFLPCLFLLCSCNTTDNKNEAPPEPETPLQPVYRRISAKEAHEIMKEGKAFILLDVRTEEEYQESRIPGSILIPDFEIISRAESELPDKNALILVYCRSGRRSESAANELVAMGYTNVFDFGGIIDWPFEIEK